VSIKNGVLYVVATPIGNKGDLSGRAIAVLQAVSLIAAEDTRHSIPLLKEHGVGAPVMALHDHNERKVIDRVISHLTKGESVALISDAGTPLISDPGFPLVRACRQQGVEVSPIPGPCAAITALSVAGLPSDRFLFEGFPARTSAARITQFESVKALPATVIYYESSHRVEACLQDMVTVFGADRDAVLARELTKLHETILATTLGELVEQVAADANQRKGEFVLVIGAQPQKENDIGAEAERVLRLLLEEMSTKQAAALTAKITGAKKNRLYQLALEIA